MWTFVIGLIGLLPLFAAAPAFAAPVSPNKNAASTATIVPPATIRKLEDLNFGCLIVTGLGGTAVLNPNTEIVSTTGGVTKVGGATTCPAYSALFEAVSPVKGVVIIRLPKVLATLTRVGGTETMTVGAWTVDGSTNRNVPAKEAWAFKVGGTLFVNANQVEGLYVGTFAVDVQYP